MNKEKKIIYFADLTHTGPVLSSNVHPLGAGLVAAYLLKHFPGQLEIELFKYPQDFEAAVMKKRPDLVGFSIYSWNQNLSYAFAKQIKKLSEDICVVFGGPNYDMGEDEVQRFWDEHPLIDFFVVREGEQALVDFVAQMNKINWDFVKLKQERIRIGNFHYAADGQIVKGPDLDRIDLNDVPSPYLLGLMDKFFSKRLMPIIQTTRGCPFHCIYCCEGNSHFNKVFHRMDIYEELEYIAERHKGNPELLMSDPNFGMVKQDVEKAKIINKIQKKYGFPGIIHVSTGKNKKERIIEVASIVNGAIRGVAAALQSTDPTVLKNIRRSNISQSALLEVSKKSIASGVDTYTEVILGLPGDTRKAHFQTVKDAVEADMGLIRLYQLIMLPNTQMNSRETREKYGTQTRYRLMQRSYGRYKLGDARFEAVEYEEIAVGSDDLTFEEYLECRELDLTIEIFHNGRTFVELMGLCHFFGLSWFDFLLEIFKKRRQLDADIKTIYDDFNEGSQALWDDKTELVEQVSNNLDSYLSNTEGTNEMATARSIAFFKKMGNLHDIVFDQMKDYLKKRNLLSAVIETYLNELKIFSLLRKEAVIDTRIVHEKKFSFDFISMMEKQFQCDPARFRLDKEQPFVFFHDQEQTQTVQSCIEEYGDTIDGLARIIMFRIHHRKLYRKVKLKAD